MLGNAIVRIELIENGTNLFLIVPPPPPLSSSSPSSDTEETSEGIKKVEEKKKEKEESRWLAKAFIPHWLKEKLDAELERKRLAEVIKGGESGRSAWSVYDEE